MSTIWDEHVEYLKTSRDEYRELVVHWRYLQGVRIALLVGVATVLATFLGAFRLFFGAISKTKPDDIDKLIIVSIPILAMTLITIAMTLERVIERMLAGVVRRGGSLEDQLRIRRGIFHDASLSVVSASPGITVAAIIGLAMLASYILWVILELVAILVAFGALNIGV